MPASRQVEKPKSRLPIRIQFVKKKVLHSFFAARERTPMKQSTKLDEIGTIRGKTKDGADPREDLMSRWLTASRAVCKRFRPREKYGANDQHLPKSSARLSNNQ
jgi:hypothetical protein